MVSIEKKTLHCDHDSNLTELELGSLYYYSSTIPHNRRIFRDVKVGKAIWENLRFLIKIKQYIIKIIHIYFSF